MTKVYTREDRERCGLNIPEGFNAIGGSCFEGCSDIDKINIPTYITSLGYKCFYRCKSLTSINIPTSVIKIGYECFSGCELLKSITVPCSVSDIGNECFGECPSLTSINIENIQFISEDRMFVGKEKLVCIKLGNLKRINGKEIRERDVNEFVMPTSITEITDGCFEGCMPLKSINIPSSVSKIGNRCFKECKSLISINIPTSVSEFGCWCFSECPSLTSIDIGNVQFISEDRVFVGKEKLASIPINNLKRINGRPIRERDINEFVIPTSIRKIGDGCFKGCSSLKSINIPSSVSKLGDNCFSECSSLKSINIPSSVKCIGDECFSGCKCEEELKNDKRIGKIYIQKGEESD
ncbi:hypothetical protein, conserved [Entamoeba dispar SAW760]|uniref:Leucine rich repeat containing protein BspA family protein n=1 Tax=Entamoeba dispar (strain ATCC PRA-260 / SAW760) TaxID=370354 RepID=B0EA33_ENTDS|nr:uncharacterized protein EDI_054240 [Entamoeba dispar SAW760]EDR28613.1 hypothetical protein, conserved [Entamoeba dispar SAW760]|eukprot:EDR28613.1 hypothetical protein, conserved [Entamoeba dispar SAW760]